jgi:trigger factor
MADVIQSAVNDANKQIVEENELKLAAEPKVNFSEDAAVIEKVLMGEGDLDFSVEVELLPKFEIADHTGIVLTREIAEPSEAEIDEAINRMAATSRPFTPRGEKEKAREGDRVTIDFVGTMQGIAFPGGTGSDVDLVLGSGQFIPGFEEQLVGAMAGDSRVVQVTFPENYQSVDLAGNAAEFAVSVKAVAEPGELALDDEFAKKFGLESVAKLREAVKGSLQEELTEQSRLKIKRQLLDQLDAVYDFELPPTMLQTEFDLVWQQVAGDMQRSGKTFAEGEEEATREDYRRIAARRVRLGLVLAEIGQKVKVKIDDAEITQAIVARARQFPGQEKQVFEYYRKNPEAIADVRAPLFEEKVVDHLIAGAAVTEKKVGREELFADPDSGEAKLEKPKKAKAKKSDENKKSDGGKADETKAD